MNYPLQLKFLAIGQQLSIKDADGNLVFYVKQKAFKLKESVTIFGDAAQSRPLYTIKADSILDFSARYQLSDVSGASLGSVKRQGMKSLWKAHYDVSDGDTPVLTLKEENAWIKVLDSVLGEVPILGLFTGYLFHPAYLAQRTDGTLVLRLQKQPSLLEKRFILEKRAELDEREEARTLLSLIMLVLLERGKG